MRLRKRRLSHLLRGVRSKNRLSIPTLASTENRQLAETSAVRPLLRRDAQDVVLHLDLASRKRRFNVLIELRYGGRAILAVEAAGVIHEDYVTEAMVAEDGLKLGCEPLLVALETGPA